MPVSLAYALLVTTDMALQIGKESKYHYILNPVKLPSGAEIHAFFLAKSLWAKPHSLRFLFLIDFQPMPVEANGEKNAYFERSAVEPGEEFGFEFQIPALPDGFHQLSVLMFTDPIEASLDDLYRMEQRNSFRETRIDIWAGLQSLPESVPAFDNEQAGDGAFARISAMDLVESDGSDKDRILKQLALRPGEQACLRLKLYNCGKKFRQESPLARQYEGIVSLHIEIYWDDHLEQVLTYNLEANAPDFETIQLNIQAPFEPGPHQLALAALPIPGYSQFSRSPT